MKIAVLSDIHGNLPALQAAIEHIDTWQPDQVIVAGDIVNRGPRPAECLQIILDRQQRLGWLLLRGNHEEYVIHFSRPDFPRNGPALEVHRPVHWTYQALDGDIRSLATMPGRLALLDPNGDEARFVHASMLGTRDGIYPETRGHRLPAKIGQPEIAGRLSLVCVGHTHRPLVRHLNGTLIVNAGSAGLPFDGDTHPSYAQLTCQEGEWRAEIIRLEYDHACAVGDFYTTGYLQDAGPLAELVLIELQTASSMLYNWAVQYQDLALAGKISIQESVQRYRQSIGL